MGAFMAITLIAVVGWVTAIGTLVILLRRQRTQSSSACVQLRKTVEPYLMRRAAELRHPVELADPGDRNLDTVVPMLAELSRQLNAREREQMGTADTLDLVNVSDEAEG